ncbi:MAG TPA: LON peptidase substrate-binding domain-containing protein, partial [Motiliproteus sp.]
MSDEHDFDHDVEPDQDQDPERSSAAEPEELVTAADEEHHSGLIVADQTLPQRIYLLPINKRPFFPAQVHPLVVNRGPWDETFTLVGESPHQMLGLSYVGEQPLEQVSSEDFAAIGCLVKVMSLSEETSHFQFVARGLRRFRVRRWLSRQPPYLVEVEYLEEPKEEDASQSEEIKAYALA